MSEINSGKEIYMTVEGVAAYLKLAAQVIRKYVLQKTIPYRKVNSAVRFRFSEIEKWVDLGGGDLDCTLKINLVRKQDRGGILTLTAKCIAGHTE